MIEILVAIILQVTTILNGGNSEKLTTEQKAAIEQKANQEKINSEQNSTAEGGQGGWAG
ncbi:hypothetical protein JAO76_09715 [Pontibacter sp. BT310]|uniref:Uncharacterized protein n=1 Tax=Pontibacter populi TaxID=890055 RepID=A0ABS6XBD8_9BACT|nr:MULTISPECIES: hypothetical protein [Pontibacter]MBJ6118468.1 hypothetical protein [Pontibacter sp. BT310]MBR0570897.1 hypothetical protein [Microvirga sp. STS03]MBW3365322.1 hypothetical protein [Pontibacter populi]